MFTVLWEYDRGLQSHGQGVDPAKSILQPSMLVSGLRSQILVCKADSFIALQRMYFTSLLNGKTSSYVEMTLRSAL